MTTIRIERGELCGKSLLESAPRGERPAIIALRAHAFFGACNYVVSRSHTLSARAHEGVATRD